VPVIPPTKAEEHHSGRQHQAPVAPPELLEPGLQGRRGAGLHRLIVQIPLHVSAKALAVS